MCFFMFFGVFPRFANDNVCVETKLDPACKLRLNSFANDNVCVETI